MTSRTHQQTPRLAAFSLVELLVVIAIFAVLATLGTSAFSSISRGTKLTSAGRLLQSEITLARQQAVTFHQEVEVRLFQTERLGLKEWNAIQIMTADSTGVTRPLRKPVLLPDGVAMDDANSTLLGSAPVSGTSDFGSHGSQIFRGFRFRPGGNTQPDLTSTNNTLMLRIVTRGQPNSPPANFFALVVNPVNGRISTYQP